LGIAGYGWLEVTRQRCRSVVTRAVASSPLRLLTPRNHGHGAWIYAGSYGGGLLGGDVLKLDVSLGPGATAMLSTQAATKVYRSPDGAVSELHARVAADAFLAVLPDPIVCFAASSYRQVQRLSVDPGASVVLVDWMVSGRHASGERWRFDRYHARLDVREGDRPLLMDATLLDGDAGDLAARMGRFNVLCVLLLLGPLLQPHASRIAAEIAARPIGRRASLLVGASLLPSGNCIVRLAGVTLEEVATAVRELLHFVPALLGDNPWARKW
jgi:urease accessory protein